MTNPFRTVYSNVFSGVSVPQGEAAYLAATLLACAAYFDAASPDPHSSGAHPNIYRDCVRRMEAMGLPHFAVKAFAARLESYAIGFDRR